MSHLVKCERCENEVIPEATIRGVCHRCADVWVGELIERYKEFSRDGPRYWADDLMVREYNKLLSTVNRQERQIKQLQKFIEEALYDSYY